MISPEELQDRFTYHAPKPGQPERYESVRSKAHALAQLAPKPTERISTERLKEVLGVSHGSYVSNLLKELRKHDLIVYEKGHPGYRFFRVGPRSLQTKPTAIKP